MWIFAYWLLQPLNERDYAVATSFETEKLAALWLRCRAIHNTTVPKSGTALLTRSDRAGAWSADCLAFPKRSLTFITAKLYGREAPA